jgi:signal transduction histidine kinase
MPAAGAPQHLDDHFLSLPATRYASLVLATVLVTATGMVGFATVEQMQRSQDWVLHTYLVRGLLKDLRSEISDGHADFDLNQLSGNANEVSQLDAKLEGELQTAAELRKLTRDNALQQEHLEQFEPVLRQDVEQLRACVRQGNCAAGGASARTQYMAEISRRRRAMSSALQNMETTEENLLQERLVNWHRLFGRMVTVLIGCFALALLLLFYNFGLLFREIQRRKKQEEIERNNAESYKMLSARILELQDVERRRIARELHDSVGQFLAGLKINLGRLQRHDLDGTERDHPLLLESLDLTERAIGEVRTISHLLHPPLLDELGFQSAARWYAEGFAKRSGIRVELHLAEIVKRLPKEIELALFRVLQESLTNVHRHAKATLVDIEVECTDDEVILVVCDDGKGLNPDVLVRFRAGHAGGIGLAGMRERLADLGGKLEVSSGPKGTEIRATLPTKECDPADTPSEDITIPPQ